MEERYETKLKLRTAHETVGWLGGGPNDMMMSSHECDDPLCGCHEARKENKENYKHSKKITD